MYLHRSDIVSSKKIDEFIFKEYEGKTVNIDNYYDKKIVGIYDEIDEYSSKAQYNMSPIDIKKLNKLNLVNNDIVEAVKDTKKIKKNLEKYYYSDNVTIKSEYEQIRRNIAILLRYINLMSKVKDQTEVSMLRERIKLFIRENDYIENDTFHKLIEEGSITRDMATSLMHDIAYVNSIVKHLLKMAKIIFTKDIPDEMELSDEEIKGIIEKTKEK